MGSQLLVIIIYTSIYNYIYIIVKNLISRVFCFSSRMNSRYQKRPVQSLVTNLLTVDSRNISAAPAKLTPEVVTIQPPIPSPRPTPALPESSGVEKEAVSTNGKPTTSGERRNCIVLQPILLPSYII